LLLAVFKAILGVISKKEIHPAILTIKDKNIMEVNINFKNKKKK